RFARDLVPNGRFLEIYVKCDLDVVKRRDTKGLYAKAIAGEIQDFTGISSPYEEPENAELVVETDIQTVDEIVDRIILELRRRGILPRS
ncbi:MAG: adenylyl-sulfate kinase, partial [Chloroflexota bacterium]